MVNLMKKSWTKIYLQCEGVLRGEKVGRWLVSARHPLKHFGLLIQYFLSLNNISDIQNGSSSTETFGLL